MAGDQPATAGTELPAFHGGSTTSRGKRNLPGWQTTRVCKGKVSADRRRDSGFVLINSAPAGMIFRRPHEQKQVGSHVLNGILALSSE